MVQLSSDYARQKELMQASLTAKREGAEFVTSPLYERLTEMQAKAERRRGRKSKWFMILVAVSVIPFVFGGDGDKVSHEAAAESGVKTVQMSPDGVVSPEQEMDNMLADNDPYEKATVSVTIGGKTISRELTISEIQKLQSMQNN